MSDESARGAMKASVHSRFDVLRVLLAAALLVATALGGAAPAAEIEGVSFPERYEVGGTRLDLRCVGLMRYKLLIKAYVAALYLHDEHHGSEPLADVAKRLELSYFWSIDADDIGPAGESILRANFDAETLARLRPQLDQINRLYEDVEPGDRYSLTYIPGVGTELALNGERKGVVEGKEFAEKYFAIWLGSKPLDSSLKQQLVSCTGSS